MNVKIQSIKFDADKKLVDFINSKMSKLGRFVENAVVTEVVLKLDKDHDKGNKVATVKMSVPGDDLIAEARSKAFEESIDECIDALKKQLERHKNRFDK